MPADPITAFFIYIFEHPITDLIIIGIIILAWSKWKKWKAKKNN